MELFLYVFVFTSPRFFFIEVLYFEQKKGITNVENILKNLSPRWFFPIREDAYITV